MFTPAEDLMLESGAVWHGSALGWSMEIDKLVCKLPIVCDRFCGIQFYDHVTKTRIIAYSVYMPTSGKDDEFLEVLASLIADLNEHNVNNDAEILLGCDSNQSLKSTKRRTAAMSSFLDEFNFQSILKNDEPTFHHNNQTSESQIDHIYSNSRTSKIKVGFFKHLCLKENPSNLSSHDAIVGKLNLPLISSTKQVEDFSSTYTPFLVKKPKWSEDGLIKYQSETAQVLKEMFSRFNMVEHIPLLSEMCSKMLVISAKNNFETSNPKNLKLARKDISSSLKNTRIPIKNMRRFAKCGD